jgi:EAL domain-containing protein (putative c-di-GMP-specific phosphodiesterase class I)
VLPSPGVFGRWGGDEFALLVPTRSAADVAALVEGIRAQLPAGRTMSAGVAIWPAGQELSTVVQRADQALYDVKRSLRGVTQVFDQAGQGLLAQAMADGELEVHYQPVVALDDESTIGAEALVRWRRPGLGLLSPAEFLAEAESSGDIIELGHWVLRQACAAAAGWPALPDGRLRTVAVNASGRELAEPGYATRVMAALAAAGLPARALVVEITEGVLDLNSSTVLDSLHDLRAAGVRLAIDDFGTGYSSLSRLGRLPVDILKIDRSFVTEIEDASSVAPLVTSVLALASSMGLRVIAEGVEQPAQARWLRDHGCPEGQGFLWSRAVPEAEFLAGLLAPRVLATVAH